MTGGPRSTWSIPGWIWSRNESRRRRPTGRQGCGTAWDFRPTLVLGDSDALERAIGNLVDNALKWSPPNGRIRISAADGTVEVSDNGPGIPADDLPYIFDNLDHPDSQASLPGALQYRTAVMSATDNQS